MLFLRPVSFFENFYDTLELIKPQGIIGHAVAPDLAVSMVATRDIADVAAKALKDGDWRGVVVRELFGQRDLTYAEATRILGERIGKPDLKDVQFSYADTARALVQAGLSEDFADLYVAMTRAFNEGRVRPRARASLPGRELSGPAPRGTLALERRGSPMTPGEIRQIVHQHLAAEAPHDAGAAAATYARHGSPTAKLSTTARRWRATPASTGAPSGPPLAGSWLGLPQPIAASISPSPP